jgi:hypothetical protein
LKNRPPPELAIPIVLLNVIGGAFLIIGIFILFITEIIGAAIIAKMSKTL